MNAMFESVIEVFEFLAKDVAVTVAKQTYKGLTMRNPCKKCLVRPICSKDCNKMKEFHYVFREGVLMTRFLAFMMIANIIMIGHAVYKILTT